MTMVEKVVRVLCVADSYDPDFDYDPKRFLGKFEPRWMLFAGRARAAIEAMREPNEAMVNKARSLIRSNLRYEEAYRHLIAAALEESPAREPAEPGREP